jgi:hypothetical protein
MTQAERTARLAAIPCKTEQIDDRLRVLAASLPLTPAQCDEQTVLRHERANFLRVTRRVRFHIVVRGPHAK